MIVIENNQIYSDEGKYVHRLGTETYFKRSTALPTDTADNFEEVDALPTFSKDEYDAKVAELIRQRYTANKEFAIQRKMINATNADVPVSDVQFTKAVSEYETYNNYVEECKVRAKNPDLYKPAIPDADPVPEPDTTPDA